MAVLGLAAAVALLWRPPACPGHPLGNFSISQYTEILVTPDTVELQYVVDLAEIPTSQEIRDTGIVPEAGTARVQGYLSRKAEALREGLLLEVDGRRLPLRTASSDVMFAPGAAGLPTMKLGLVYRAALPPQSAPGSRRLRYLDANFAGRLGWKEVVAVPAWGVTFASSSVPSRDRSRALADYPADLLDHPPQILEARVDFARRDAPAAAAGEEGPQETRNSSTVLPGGPGGTRVNEAAGATQLALNRQGTPRSRFTDLMTAPDLNVRVVLIGLIVAAALGAFHALEPGHGKTIVAAYLIGSRGTAWHAALLGLIVTASHTAGVYLLGVVTLYASRYVMPERLYPWLGVTSGLVVAGVGVALLLRRRAGDGEDHAHDHHHHGPAGHHHAHALHHHHDAAGEHRHAPGDPAARRVSLPALVALGVTGGIIPCPAALVVLLSALSLHRVEYGLLLIVAFSAGLAGVLIGIGVLMVVARRFAARIPSNGPLIARWLPLASALVITLLGVGMTAQAILTAGLLGARPG